MERRITFDNISRLFQPVGQYEDRSPIQVLFHETSPLTFKKGEK